MKKKSLRLVSLLLALLCLISAAWAEWDWMDALLDIFDSAPVESSEMTEKPELPITKAQDIVNYIDKWGELPENFITKAQAKALGWDSRNNYLSDVAPGMSIGGDRFGNYEGRLPDARNRKWYECDVNYHEGKRNAQRLVYSTDALYYYTVDHYETFKQMFPEADYD